MALGHLGRLAQRYRQVRQNLSSWEPNTQRSIADINIRRKGKGNCVKQARNRWRHRVTLTAKLGHLLHQILFFFLEQRERQQ